MGINLGASEAGWFAFAGLGTEIIFPDKMGQQSRLVVGQESKEKADGMLGLSRVEVSQDVVVRAGSGKQTPRQYRVSGIRLALVLRN